MPVLFGVTLFVSATLLFVVQPLVGKLLLPTLGGTPAVWSACMVFFQAVLLLGYLYAHAAAGRLAPRRQALLHLAVLAVPLTVIAADLLGGGAPFLGLRDADPDVAAGSHPTVWLLGLLFAFVALPFFAVSTSAPLLQKWFAGTGHRSSGDPYFLYAASNLGSMVALLGYPLLIEPNLPLADQGKVWAVGYGVFVVATAACAVALWTSPAAVVHRDLKPDNVPLAAEQPITARRRLRWVVLAMVPSSLMLGVTNYLSTDLAAIPLLWVIPLAIYLLTFILVFASRPPVRHALMVRLLPALVVLLAVVMLAGATEPLSLLVVLHLATFFVAAMVCHGELARDRPGPRHLTEFFLLMSVGGVLGGLFNALIAPVVFTKLGLVEYPLMLVVACLLRPAAPGAPGLTRTDFIAPALLGVLAAGLVTAAVQFDLTGPARTGLAYGLPAVAAFTFADRPIRFGLAVGALMLAGALDPGLRGKTVFVERNFFGVVRVTEDPKRNARLIVHGNTMHGLQSLDPSRELEPSSYYHRSGPVGDIFAEFNSRPGRRNVGIAGLGAGGLACYARPGDRWVYYEIDPAVEYVARNYFTFLSKAFANPSDCSVELGDARLVMRRAPAKSFDLVMLDAFSSDAVPVHLLTREAVRDVYLDKLADGGILVFNVSNRYLDLQRVLAALAADLGLEYRTRTDPPEAVTPQQRAEGKESSRWVVMARSAKDLGALAGAEKWGPYGGPTGRVWTDDYSDPLGTFRWR